MDTMTTDKASVVESRNSHKTDTSADDAAETVSKDNEVFIAPGAPRSSFQLASRTAWSEAKAWSMIDSTIKDSCAKYTGYFFPRLDRYRAESMHPHHKYSLISLRDALSKRLNEGFQIAKNDHAGEDWCYGIEGDFELHTATGSDLVVAVTVDINAELLNTAQSRTEYPTYEVTWEGTAVLGGGGERGIWCPIGRESLHGYLDCMEGVTQKDCQARAAELQFAEEIESDEEDA